MKYTIFLAAGMALLFTVTSCTDKKYKETSIEAAVTEEVDNTATDADSINIDTANAAKPVDSTIITVTGKVTHINPGKDGYSATISADDGRQYTATISIPNMADPKKYRQVQLGDEITVTGETFIVEEDIMIKATALE